MIGAAFDATLAAAQDGDEAAFTRLFRDVQPALLRYLQVIAPMAADEVASGSWLDVVEGLAGFRGGEAAFRERLFTIARRRAMGQGRRRGRHRAAGPTGSAATERLTAPGAAATTPAPAGPRAALAAVATLPRDEAEMIMLRAVAGLDVQQVARITGTTPGAVRVAAHRGLRRLASLADPTAVTT